MNNHDANGHEADTAIDALLAAQPHRAPRDFADRVLSRLDVGEAADDLDVAIGERLAARGNAAPDDFADKVLARIAAGETADDLDQAIDSRLVDQPFSASAGFGDRVVASHASSSRGHWRIWAGAIGSMAALVAITVLLPGTGASPSVPPAAVGPINHSELVDMLDMADDLRDAESLTIDPSAILLTENF